MIWLLWYFDHWLNNFYNVVPAYYYNAVTSKYFYKLLQGITYNGPWFEYCDTSSTGWGIFYNVVPIYYYNIGTIKFFCTVLQLITVILPTMGHYCIIITLSHHNLTTLIQRWLKVLKKSYNVKAVPQSCIAIWSKIP